MPEYVMTSEIESGGRTISVTACDPEFYDEIVEDCTVRTTIGEGESLTGADEHAIDAWLHGIYYPYALGLRMNEALEDAAEALFEGSEADARDYGPGDADFP